MADEARSRLPVKPGDVVGGKYRVERTLGAGGMGVVVAAVHVDLGHPVALKFILPDSVSGKDAVERFMREARAVARLKSEHVARVFDVGRDEHDNPYMVLELLEGRDLATLTKQERTIAPADAVEYVLQACEGLIEAHAAGIVHRDLKPQNLFVTRRLNGSPLVKVLDFGIAKAVGAAAVGQLALTDSQAVIGSPLYMAPEHMRSARAADTRSDVWSLGVILYELLGGQLPFDGDTVTEVCIRVVNEAPPALVALRPELDPRLVDVTMRCLEKDPARRWQTVAQLAGALEPFARSSLVGAVVRPWRSLEDTADLAVSAPAVARSSNPVAGPAPSSSAAVGSTGGERKLASTAASWGADTAATVLPETVLPRARFRAGMGVGALVAFAVAAIAVLAFRPSTPAASFQASPVAAPTPSAVEPAPSAPHMVAPSATVEPPASAIASESRPRPAPPRAPRPPVAKPSAAPAQPVAPAETEAPNGAPILR